jgi:2-polyprenyl-3-methyl-5-hydroxy-6-metoxy-1,4-benzoquinol methylase
MIVIIAPANDQRSVGVSMTNVRGAMDWLLPFFRHQAYVGFHQAFVSQRATSEETDFIERATGLEVEREPLDVPCGEGRMAMEPARRGHRVTGVDLSEPLINVAWSAASRPALRAARHAPA